MITIVIADKNDIQSIKCRSIKFFGIHYVCATLNKPLYMFIVEITEYTNRIKRRERDVGDSRDKKNRQTVHR